MNTKTTQEERDRIVELYEKHIPIIQIADMVYMCRQTVTRCLIQEGIQPVHNKRINIPMIMHDWNAGHGVDRIAYVYGFRTANAVYQWVNNQRKAGHGFNKRHKR